MYRLATLPRGELEGTATGGPDHHPAGLQPSREFSPISAIGQMLASQGTAVPTAGGSIGYVTATYNNFATIKVPATSAWPSASNGTTNELAFRAGPVGRRPLAS
jgi:hypothetical protein